MSVSRYAHNGTRRRKIRARIKAQAPPCGICGHSIDYSLPAMHPLSFEVDEIEPVSLGGSELDINNCQASHRCCNQAKGNRRGFTLPCPAIYLQKDAKKQAKKLENVNNSGVF